MDKKQIFEEVQNKYVICKFWIDEKDCWDDERASYTKKGYSYYEISEQDLVFQDGRVIGVRLFVPKSDSTYNYGAESGEEFVLSFDKGSEKEYSCTSSSNAADYTFTSILSLVERASLPSDAEIV